MIPQRFQGPALLRALNQVGRSGRPLVHLDADAMVASARRRTGLEDLGSDFDREPFDRAIASIDSEAKLNLVGRIAARKDTLRLLASRLRMQEDLRRHPEIASQPIRRPIFVTGLPRTGTTLLHGLLAQDPRARAPLGWEMLYPSPPPRRSLSGRDPRIGMADRQIRWFHRLAPEFQKIHPTGALLPEECLVITSHCFESFQFQTMYEVPSYETWLESRDLSGCYRWHRRFLQHLDWGNPTGHWVLKAPAHLFGIEALMAAYPDAGLVFTHRAPLEVVGSLASLTVALRSVFSDEVDPVATGAEMTRRWHDGLERALRARDAGVVPKGRVADVLYRDLMRDPFGVVRGLYDALDMEFTPEFDRRMRAWLAENPKDRRGRHRYSLDEFGLDPDEETARYGAYARRFDL